MNPIVIFLLISLVSAHCLEDDNCEQMDFPTSQDEIRMRENSALEGHLLSEHNSPNHYSCFVRCADNCRCLSFNFKSYDGVAANCQLKEAASYTNPESIKPKTGWAYIEMVRSYLTKPPWRSCSSDSCENGCCQSSPCENGGTCHEICDVRARRFKCACPLGYTGHRCHKTLRSCHDIMLSGRHANGIYQMRNETNGILNVYCDFESEPGAAWTLVQSYSLEKGKMGSVKDIFSTKSLYEDFPVNEESPDDWSSFRVSLANMKLIRAHSTHWRATCEFPTIGIDFRDYFRVLFEEYDVLIPDPDAASSVTCKLYEFINIRGNQCINCTAVTAIYRLTAPFVTVNSNWAQCNLDIMPNGGIQNEMNFGSYGQINQKAFDAPQANIRPRNIGLEKCEHLSTIS